MADITAAAQSPTDIVGKIIAALKRGEVALALGVVAILTVMILPMPAWLLDISLALSITLSVLILMVGLFIQRPCCSSRRCCACRSISPRQG